MHQSRRQFIILLSIVILILPRPLIAHSMIPRSAVRVIAETILHPPRLGHGVPIKVLRKLSPYCLMPIEVAVGLRKIKLSILIVSPITRLTDNKLIDAHTNCSIRSIANNPTHATILLLPGIGMPKSALLPYANYYASHGVRSILIDLQGQGDSGGRTIGLLKMDVSDLRNLIGQMESNHLISGNCGVLGLSYGAAVALDLAAFEPKITLVISVAPFSQVGEALKKFIASYDSELTRNVSVNEWSQILNRVSALAGVKLASWSPWRTVGLIKAFVFYIGGERDPISPPNTIRRLAKLTTRKNFIIVSNKGHSGITSDWQLVTRASDKYVKRYLLTNMKKRS